MRRSAAAVAVDILDKNLARYKVEREPCDFCTHGHPLRDRRLS